MLWNWQKPGWPNFRYDAAALAPLEQRFLLHRAKFWVPSTICQPIGA
ncbi:DUF4172 domain-containing protein [uncultured Tateyamaria sp.]|nr:DUF4172 domain-containing protein [uncultured Tateyamaria sp.]